ncbi:hypothetical protein L484_023682 [Morus notabilis]|uniref:Uncharacterized protein n=1 Tax=Morus notabilis TaxID=981085 RepID=W9RLX9_9ROSA|nr:hypothetical protein L484_023682 [Morus notabilis]
MPITGLALDMQQWLSSLYDSHMELVKEMMELRPGVLTHCHSTPPGIVLPKTDEEHDEDEENGENVNAGD